MKLNLFAITVLIMFIGQDIDAQSSNRQQVADSTYARIMGDTKSNLWQSDRIYGDYGQLHLW